MMFSEMVTAGASRVPEAVDMITDSRAPKNTICAASGRWAATKPGSTRCASSCSMELVSAGSTRVAA